ncbi:MAG: MarR family transcriptional regulator [Acidimicrobiales bacterium]
MDTEQMATEGMPAAVPAADAMLEHPSLTVVGLLFESAHGAADLLEATFPPGSQLSGQLFEPLLRLSRTDGGRLRMTDLAAQCRYSPSAVTRVSDRLEQLGLAARQSCPSDRRVVYLSITDAGRTAIAECMPEHVRVVDTEILGALDEAERTQLESLLRRVRDAVHPCAVAVTPAEADEPTAPDDAA